MKTFETDIQKLAEKTRLKAVEREMVRDRILTYMEYHPLQKEALHTGLLSRLKQNEFIYIDFTTSRVKMAMGVFALLLVIGVPMLAERTVPGDVLYMVKTGVNESIRTQLATSPYEKVQLETKLMERRITEARLLAEEGKLTEEVEAEIAKTVKVHADAVQSGIAALREDDAEGAAIAEIVFNSALEVQSAVLGEASTGTSTQGDALRDVVDTVRNEVADDTAPLMPSYDSLLARIELETTRAYELFETIKESASDEEIADIERRLDDIGRSITAEKVKKESDEVGAVNGLTETLGAIQKLIAFMTDIDVRETVTLETLVPIKLTDEERIAVAQSHLDDVVQRTTIVRDTVSAMMQSQVREKVMHGLQKLEELTDMSLSSLADRDITALEVQVRDAAALVSDLEKLVGDSNPLPDAPIELPEEIIGSDASTTEEQATSTQDEATSTVEEGEAL